MNGDNTMIKTTLGIEGMMCSHCEAHVTEAIKKQFKVKKVSSSHEKKSAEIVSEEPIDENQLRKAVEDAGYKMVSFKTEPVEKKGLFH